MRLLILLLTAALASLAAPPGHPHVERIISTAPSITETLFAMGLGPKVVGVTVYCAHPPEVLKLPKIGTYLKPDIETIVALHPDLVVAHKQGNHLGEELARVHVPYIEVQSYDMEDIYQGAMEIGKATGEEADAQHFIAKTKAELTGISTVAAHLKTKPSAVFIVGHTPGSLEGLIAGAAGSYFSDLLTVAGATNIFADAVAPYPKISMEEMLSRNPDVILELSGDTKAREEEVLSLWSTHTSLRAVAGHHVYAVPSSPFLVPGPRAPEAARLLLHMLHPELSVSPGNHP